MPIVSLYNSTAAIGYTAISLQYYGRALILLLALLVLKQELKSMHPKESMHQKEQIGLYIRVYKKLGLPVSIMIVLVD